MRSDAGGAALLGTGMDASAVPDAITGGAPFDATLDISPEPKDAPNDPPAVISDAPAEANNRPIDARVDAASDPPAARNDAANDASRDASSVQPDASGPFVCLQDGDCKVPGLYCLVLPGLPGRCVECLGNGHCVNPGARFCDPILNRCVECVVAADCPSPSSVYPSTCTPVSHRCQTGCEDDSTTACPTTRNYHCVDNLYLCVECQPATAATDCAASPHGSICHPSEFVCVRCVATTCLAGLTCDPLSGRCVECKSSRDCLAPGMPLCDPVTLTCVPVPP